MKSGIEAPASRIRLPRHCHMIPADRFVSPSWAYPRLSSDLPAWWRPIAPRTAIQQALPGRKRRARVKDESTRKHAALRPGTIVGRYRIVEFLGSGSFAAVYLASHLALKSPFSLKILHGEILKSRPGLARMLCDEARIAASVQHPNLVRVVDLCQGADLTYIVLEYIPGLSLAACIRDRGHLPPAEVAAIAVQVARGLQEAHRHGIIHRDIKPANILITDGGDVKLIDLGLAHRAGAARQNASSSRKEMIGTPLYMAPEQAENPGGVDFRADIYALGATLYHAAVGHPPFTGRGSAELIAAKQNGTITPPERFGIVLPAEFRDVLYWFLRKDKGSRPESYYVVIETLEALRRTLSDPS